MLATVQPFGIGRYPLHRCRYAVTVLRRWIQGRRSRFRGGKDKPRGAAFACAVGLAVIRFRVGLAIVPLRFGLRLPR